MKTQALEVELAKQPALLEQVSELATHTHTSQIVSTAASYLCAVGTWLPPCDDPLIVKSPRLREQQQDRDHALALQSDHVSKALGRWHGLTAHGRNVREVFGEIDTNKDGRISRSELAIAFKAMDLDVPEEELDAILDDLGGGQEQEVTFEAFLFRLESYQEQLRLACLLRHKLDIPFFIAQLVLAIEIPFEGLGAPGQDGSKLKARLIKSLAHLSTEEISRQLRPLVARVVSVVKDVAISIEEHEANASKAQEIAALHRKWSTSPSPSFGPSSAETSNKFLMPVQARFGHLEIFHKGLDVLIGLPAVDVLAGMIREHDDMVEFTALNYNTTTCAHQEWEFVYNPSATGVYPDEKVAGREHGRVRKLLSDLMLAPQCVAAKLSQEEVLGLRLYTVWV